MAKIKSFTKNQQRRIRNEFKEVNCTYTTANIFGEKYVVFCTAGSQDNGVSQTLHFDLETAKDMIRILKAEFNIE